MYQTIGSTRRIKVQACQPKLANVRIGAYKTALVCQLDTAEEVVSFDTRAALPLSVILHLNR